MTIKEVTIVAGIDFRIMPMINDHRDSTMHIITVVIAIGIHVRSIDGWNVPSNILKDLSANII